MPRKTPGASNTGLPVTFCFNEAAARCRGKRAVGAEHAPARREASMRPRPDAAENQQKCQVRRVAGGASMRPRPDAAENWRAARTDRAGRRSFNEAAARCRGKHTGATVQTGASVAELQ